MVVSECRSAGFICVIVSPYAAYYHQADFYGNAEATDLKMA